MAKHSSLVRRLTLWDRVNVYVVDTPRGPVLVDSAWPGMLGWLTRGLRRHGVALTDLAGIVLTHAHLDHAGTALALARRGLAIHALAEEVPILTGQAPAPGYSGIAGRCLRGVERIVFPHRTFTEVVPLRADTRLFDSPWRIVASPGHTPGSLALLHEESGDLLSGDTLVSNGGRPRQADRLFSADHARARASARALLELRPTAIHPGHGRPLPAAAYANVLGDGSRVRIVETSP